MASSNQFCVHPENYLTEAQPQHGSQALSPRLKCGDCDCPIVGKAFHCAACSSDLHPFCKSCPPNFTSRLHHCPLTRLNGGFVNHRCAVCEEEITGRVSYTCSGCKFDIHPLCSQLPLVVRHGQHSLRLQVHGSDNRAECDVCRRQCFKYAYRCDISSVSLHYSCLSEKIVLNAGDGPAAAPPADTVSRCLGQPWGFNPPHHHGGNYGYGAGSMPYYNYNCGGGFSGQGYGAGLPNYGPYGVPNSYNQYPYGGSGGGGFQNHFSNNAGSGSGGGAGWSMGGMIGKIGGSLAVGVLCNLVADQIHGIFVN